MRCKKHYVSYTKFYECIIYLLYYILLNFRHNYFVYVNFEQYYHIEKKKISIIEFVY